MNTKTLRDLVAIAMPMVVSQGAFALMIFTDRLFMSQISPAHMSASLGGGVAFHFSLSLFMGTLSYANALVAQYYGGGHLERCSRVVSQGVVLSFLFTPFLFLIALFAGEMFLAMGHSPQQAKLETTYYHILMWASPIVLLKVCLASFFSGIGETKKVMIADVSGAVVNIPLSYMLIFGVGGFPELGIVGAGIGTFVSNVFALAIFSIFYFHRHNARRFKVRLSWIYDRGIFRRYLRLGLPSGTEMFLNVAAFNIFLLMFQSYGIAEGASAAIVFNWDILSFVPMMGLNIGIVSLIGRYIGANNMEKTNEVIAAGFILAITYSSLLGILFVVFRLPLVEIFLVEGADYKEIVALATFMMIGLATYVMADATILVAGGVLRGAGDTRWMMIVSVLIHWLMLIVQIVVIKVYEYGPKVSWVVFVIMILSTAAIYLVRMLGQKWRDPEVLKAVMADQ